MASSSKRKGDRAELEVQALIRDLTGWPARRKLGAGRADDMGDVDNVPATVVQVASWKEALRAVREKPVEAEAQRGRAGATFACTWVRLRGGVWRVVLTPEQWAMYTRESFSAPDGLGAFSPETPLSPGRESETPETA